MVCTRQKRTQAEQNPPAPDLAEEVAGLRGQIAAQAEESRQLRELLTQLIQGQQVGGAPPPQAVPAQAAQPEQPAERVEPQEPVRGDMGYREMVPREPLYVRFKRMAPPEFDGSTYPLEAEEWLASIQTVFEFMELTDREKIQCAAFVLKKDARYWWESVCARRNVRQMLWDEFLWEFNHKYYNLEALKTQQNEFNNLKQGDQTVVEACRRFDQLA